MRRRQRFCATPSSGRALAQKKGWGRCKHVDVKMAWVQESLILHGIRLGAVRTDDNTADVGTKTLSQVRLAFLSRKLGLEDLGGDQQVLMIEKRDDPEETPTPWLFYVFLASLTMNAMTAAWHYKCKRALPCQAEHPFDRRRDLFDRRCLGDSCVGQHRRSE